jgi:ATP-dependent helicase/nuclease subunit A
MLDIGAFPSMSATTPQQSAAIIARGNILVAAGAGTGKTSTVTERCLDLVLRERCSIEEILMVTFTEAAAAEMRERLRKKIREAADVAAGILPAVAPGFQPGGKSATSNEGPKGSEAPAPARPNPDGRMPSSPAGETPAATWLAEQLALLDHAPISTLHSFCLELVRRNFHTLGLDPQFSVLDEAQTKPLIHTVLDELFLAHYASETAPARAVRELIRTYGRGSDDNIRRLIVQLHQHAQTLAAPEAWFAAQTALFNNPSPDAWRELFQRTALDWKLAWRDTIEPYAQGSKTVRTCASALDHISPTSTFAEIATQLTAIQGADKAKWDGLKKDFRDPIKGFFEQTGFLLELAQSDGVALAEDWNWSREPMLTLLRLAQEFGAAFSKAKRELGGVDFADQEQFALHLLFNPDGSPTAVAQACRAKFRFVFVDECQDINAAQDAIIRAASREGAEANRFLVGDVKQSIYRFRLADPRIFQTYEARWRAHEIPSPALSAPLSPSDGERAGARGDINRVGCVLALTENFRSAEGLLRFINPVFRTLMRPVVGGLVYDANAELQFGAPEARPALSAAKDSRPRVELHILTKDDETISAGEDPTESDGKAKDFPDLQSAEREASLIARQLRHLKESQHPIWNRDAKNGGFRPVEYSDMVVLLRGIAGRAEIFAKAFHQAGVPLRASRAGFLTALEVSDVLNLLRLLDNPLQDLPLLAVLRSPLVGLAANELAQIRSAEPRGLLWIALSKLAIGHRPSAMEPERRLQAAAAGPVELLPPEGGVPNDLRLKLIAFVEQFHRWRELVRHSSLTHCMETALNETHYEALLLADERGAERVANVRRVVEMARRFDPFQREGLYRFLQFIGEQEEAEVNHQPAETAHENAVRLMTIHASKGLEFPVVVLAGMGGRFNVRDLSGDVLLDEESGLCPKVFPPNTRSKYPSLAHWSAAQRERRALLGEELRLLYVAMTRARDNLLLVGTATRKDEAERWQATGPITNQALLKAGNYLDWLRLWFVHETQTTDWVADGIAGENKLLRWKFWVANDSSFTSTQSKSLEVADAIAAPTSGELDQIRQTLATRYEHEAASNEPAKTTVTAIRRRIADETDDEARPFFQPTARVTFSPRTDSPLSAAAIGTAHHTFLQFVALPRTATELDLRNEAVRLEREGTLTPEQAEALDFAALNAFWQSELGVKLRAQPDRLVNREMPFTARFQVAEVAALLHPHADLGQATLKTDDDFIIVQGIADLVVLLPDEIWLVDFKTDHVASEDLAAKVQHYEPQLKLYALALARIYRRKVTTCCLHFLSARETAYVWV